MAVLLRTVCPLFPIARRVPVTEDVVFPGAFAAFRLRSASNPSPARFQAEGKDVRLLPDKRSHLRKRRRQRTMCEAAGTGLVVSARARWSDPPPVRKCARGPEQKDRALRNASSDARDRARPQPRSAYPNHRPASMKKGRRTVAGSRPLFILRTRRAFFRARCGPPGSPAEPAGRCNRLRLARSNPNHRPRRYVIEVAVQRASFGNRQCFEVAFRVRRDWSK